MDRRLANEELQTAKEETGEYEEADETKHRLLPVARSPADCQVGHQANRGDRKHHFNERETLWEAEKEQRPDRHFVLTMPLEFCFDRSGHPQAQILRWTSLTEPGG
jgi:hypothetical protein